jgi:hypothetical protein
MTILCMQNSTHKTTTGSIAIVDRSALITMVTRFLIRSHCHFHQNNKSRKPALAQVNFERITQELHASYMELFFFCDKCLQCSIIWHRSSFALRLMRLPILLLTLSRTIPHLLALRARFDLRFSSPSAIRTLVRIRISPHSLKIRHRKQR